MNKVRIFYSYAHEDAELRDQLLHHLSGLEDLVENWCDTELLPGAEWDGTIKDAVRQADIILLLISADFLASKYIKSVELACALERADRKETVVIPILLRPVDWGNAPFSRFQALPTGARPVVKWHSHDEAFSDIAAGIRRVVEQLTGPARAGESPAPPIPTPTTQARVLDAAMASHIPMGKPADLAVMVRRTESSGLKAVLQIEDEYSAEPDDVRSKPFQMEFPLDHFGHLEPATLTLKLDSPDFEPNSQSKKLMVPPDRDSDVCTFLMTPLFAGELILNLEVYAGEGQQISRMFRVTSEASDRVVQGRRLLSVPISTVVEQKQRGAAATAVMAQPAAATPPAHGGGPPAAARPGGTVSMPAPAPHPPATVRKKSYLPHSIGAAAAVVLVSSTLVYYKLTGPAGVPAAETEIAQAVSRPSPVTAIPPSSPADSGAGRVGSDSGFAASASARIEAADRASAAEKPQLLAQAEEDAHRAVAIRETPHNYLVQGIALERVGKLAEAEAALRKSTQLDPSQDSAWYALGVVLHDTHQTDEAVSALQQAVKLNPSNNDARLLLSATLANKNPVAAKREVDLLLRNPALGGKKLDAARRLSSELSKQK